MPCSACGWDNPANSRFCNQCGAAQPSVVLIAPGAAVPTAAARVASAAPADPPRATTSVEEELRRLAERVARLERRLPIDGLPPVVARPPSTSRLPALGALLAPDWHAVRAAARPLPAGAARWLVALAAVAALLAAWLLGPFLWSALLPQLRAWLNQRPLPVAIALAGGLLAVLSAGALVRGIPACPAPAASAERLGGGRRRPVAFLWTPGGVVLALGLAAVGQGLLLAHQDAAGVACYLAAGALAWWRARADSLLGPSSVLQWTIRHERLLLVLVLAVGAFLHLVRLGTYPMGYEGDEDKWTHSVAQYMLAGEHTAWPANAFFDYAPLSFLYLAPIFHLFGPSIFVARVVVAALGLGATVLFYLFARRALSVPVALLATLVMGVSIADLSASRMANVESHLKFWAVLAALTAACAADAAVRSRPVRSAVSVGQPSPPRSPASDPARMAVSDVAAAALFGLAGLAVVGGLFTYDIFPPMSAVTGLYLGLTLLLALVRQPRAWRRYLLYGVAFAVPILVAAPRVLMGLHLRQGVFTGFLPYWGQNLIPSPHNVAQVLQYVGTNLDYLLRSLFIRQYYGDFLLNRDGPFENAALLPFLVLGLAWLLARLRTRHNLLIALWLVLLFLPTPLLIGAVWFRVVYPGFPALYLCVAIGLWWVYTALAASVPRAWQPGLATLLVGFLGIVTVFNGYIYFHEVDDFEDRLHRRALSDEIAAAIGPGKFLFLAYQPDRADFIDVEREPNRLAVWQRAPVGHEDAAYRQVPYADLLPSIFRLGSQYQAVTVIAAGPQYELGGDRREALNALERCFPGTTTETGRYEVIYTLPGTALANPACTLDGRAALLAPAAGATLPSGTPVGLAWRRAAGVAREFAVEVQRRNDAVLRVDATGFQGPGWATDTRFLDGFSGPGFLLDLSYQSGPATDVVDVPAAGAYEVWVRAARRVDDDTHVYLDAGDGPREFARAGTTRLNEWVWESLGTVDLPAGSRRLTLTKDYGTAPHMAMFVDKIILSRDLTFQPDDRSEWDTVLDATVPASDGDEYRGPAPLLDAGRYRWRVQMRDGDRLIDHLGHTGLWTPYQEFSVR
ncbi:MAG TPA: hypothetical protein VK066_05820 [Chloroflexota bacterium]|nr:hypothetical protein [Chloroflexota bacterium]